MSAEAFWKEYIKEQKMCTLLTINGITITKTHTQLNM